METVYKSYEAIQYNGTNQNKFYTLLAKYNIFEPVAISDWLVYSPYKYKWKVYTNSEYISTFKTLKQIQDENQL